MDRTQLEQRSQQFAVQIIALCQGLRTTAGFRAIADQLQNAATSAAANYRASARARSRAEFVAKLGIVNEECDEAVYWLEIMAGSKIGDELKVNDLMAEAKQLRAIFAASYRTARRGRDRARR